MEAFGVGDDLSYSATANAWVRSSGETAQQPKIDLL